MSKVFSKTNLQRFVFFTIILIRCIFYLSERALGFYIRAFDFDITAQSVLLITAVLVFSAVFSIIIEKLITTDSAILVFPVLLFFLDPLFKNTFTNFTHFLILILDLFVICYLVKGKSTVGINIVTALFILLISMLYEHAAYSHVPLILLVYIFNCDFKKTKSRNSFLISFILLMALSFAAALLNRKLSDNFPALISFSINNFNTTILLPKLFAVSIPYLAIEFIFIKKYLENKFKRNNFDFEFLIQNAAFVFMVPVVYLLMLVGILVFKYTESFTMLNLTVPLTIIAMYYNDSTVVKATIEQLLNRIKAKPAAWTVVLILWVIISQNFFQGIQDTLWNNVLSIVGGLL